MNSHDKKQIKKFDDLKNEMEIMEIVNQMLEMKMEIKELKKEIIKAPKRSRIITEILNKIYKTIKHLSTLNNIED